MSSLPWRLASRDALAEWTAVTQFSRSVWLLACEGRKEGAAPFRGQAHISRHRLNSDVITDRSKPGCRLILSYIKARPLGGEPGPLDRYEIT